jgi:hypothetical protein
MNERIKELAQQAGFKVNWHNADVQAIKMARLEKFAELIVQECATLCDLYAMPDGTSETAIILASAIRRKFGVEPTINETLRNRSTYFGNDI